MNRCWIRTWILCWPQFSIHVVWGLSSVIQCVWKHRQASSGSAGELSKVHNIIIIHKTSPKMKVIIHTGMHTPICLQFQGHAPSETNGNGVLGCTWWHPLDNTNIRVMSICHKWCDVYFIHMFATRIVCPNLPDFSLRGEVLFSGHVFWEKVHEFLKCPEWAFKIVSWIIAIEVVSFHFISGVQGFHNSFCPIVLHVDTFMNTPTL